MDKLITFYTATCLNWQPLLADDNRKQIILDSLIYHVNSQQIYLYSYVIMPNHIHLLWLVREGFEENKVRHNFMKYTAQQLKFHIQKNEPDLLSKLKSTQVDRKFQIWERNPFKANMYNRKVLEQKLDYIHYNPVEAELVAHPFEYKFSSAKFYGEKEYVSFLTRYEEHI